MDNIYTSAFVWYINIQTLPPMEYFPMGLEGRMWVTPSLATCFWEFAYVRVGNSFLIFSLWIFAWARLAPMYVCLYPFGSWVLHFAQLDSAIMLSINVHIWVPEYSSPASFHLHFNFPVDCHISRCNDQADGPVDS